MRYSMLLGVLALSLLAPPAFSQQAPAGRTVAASEPGRAATASVVRASAIITEIDKATRKVTLKRANGESVDLVAGDDVKNFDQLKVGDEVVVKYVRALSLELKKGGVVGRTDSSGAASAKPGDRPAAVAASQVTVVTEVVDVNPKRRTISLKGPKGNVVELAVNNQDHFKVVRKGDMVEAVYTEAIAISVESAPQKAAGDMQAMRAKLKADKKALVAKNMELTEAEARDFWPLYEEFQKELQTINGRIGTMIAAYAKEYKAKSLTDQTAASLLEQSFAIEEAETKLKRSFAPRFARVLPSTKVARYMQIENKIRAMVKYDIAREVPLAQ